MRPGQWDGEYQQGVALYRGPSARCVAYPALRWGFPSQSSLGLAGSRPPCRSFTTTINGYPNMAGMWLSGKDLPHRGNERKISQGLNRGNAMVSETQLAFLRSIDTPTVWPRTEEEARQLAIELLSGLPHLDDGDTLGVVRRRGVST